MLRPRLLEIRVQLFVPLNSKLDLVGVPYTAVQFPLWIVAKSEYGMVDYVDNAAQVVLIVVLLYLYLNTPSESAGNASPATD